MNHSIEIEQIESRFKSLPPDVREAITSVKVEKIIQDIAKKHKLTIDKAGELIDETAFVMLGLTPSREYLNKVKNKLGLGEEVARLIVADVNEEIFKPIRESLKKIQGFAITEEEADDETKSQAYTAYGGSGKVLQKQDLSEPYKKILSQSGIDIIDNPQLSVHNNEEVLPDKKELIAAIEKPTSIEKRDGPTIPAGFSLETRVVEQKSDDTSIISKPQSQANIKNDSGPNKHFDPYREPIE